MGKMNRETITYVDVRGLIFVLGFIKELYSSVE